MHPELGTIDDFDEFVVAARDRGLEVALDLALQCAPDHPWVTAASRSGSPPGRTARIAYAENPPKKYQDIYPMNFDNDPEGVYAEVLRVVRFWIEHGVTRLPGRQPAHQADQLLGVADRQGARDEPGGDLPRRGVHQARDDARAGPDRLHASRTPTSPGAPASRRSPTTRVELVEASDYMRPNFFVNTPDILHASLQFGGPGDVRDPRGAGGDAVADLGRVLRVRAVRARGGAAGQRGVPGLGEVPAAAAGLRRARCSRAAPCSR